MLNDYTAQGTVERKLTSFLGNELIAVFIKRGIYIHAMFNKETSFSDIASLNSIDEHIMIHRGAVPKKLFGKGIIVFIKNNP